MRSERIWIPKSSNDETKETQTRRDYPPAAQCDGSGLSQESFARQKQISVATLHRWRKKYGQMDEADAKRLKALEKENTELKKMYAEAMLGIKVLQETIEKKL